MSSSRNLSFQRPSALAAVPARAVGRAIEQLVAIHSAASAGGFDSGTTRS
jgi:hypothetical protein